MKTYVSIAFEGPFANQIEVEESTLVVSTGKLSSRKDVPKGRTTRIGLILLAALGPFAASALAVSPQVSITCTSTNNCTVAGTGFTPGGQVLAQAFAGSTVFSSINLVASASTRVCVTGVKPVCYQVGGGTFGAALPVDYALACNATAGGNVKYTDVTTGIAVSKPITWTGPCLTPTTTTLTLPSTVDTSWTPPANPAAATAGSTRVTSGTITITVNGSFFCQYGAGASTGCTSYHLPAGTDQVEAAYSGSTQPPYEPSSATAIVTVLPVDPSISTSGPYWAGYVAVGDTFTSASASWTVPKANCGLFENSTSATWVGIDGFNESTVEQIGTDSNCIAGQGEYWAWYEMFPNGPQTIGTPYLSGQYAVNPGDLMTARVTSMGSPGWYTLTIADNTQGWTFSTNQFYPNTLGGTAECIVEQPSTAGTSLPLTNFGSVSFTQCEVVGSDRVITPIWDHTNYALNMANGGTNQATVSPLSGGTSFTVTWLHN